MTLLVRKGLRNLIHRLGYEIKKNSNTKLLHPADEDYKINIKGLNKIHYGSGINLFHGWVNVDSLPIDLITAWRTDQIPNAEQNPVDQFCYHSLDLTSRQPFLDNTFDYGFSEDFIEHISQAESIIFLSECYRVLKKGGILRLSFPGLEGVLKNHFFSPTGYKSAYEAKKDCYDQWEHIHFYSRDELSLVARHLGYSTVSFPAYGVSNYPELIGLDTRINQQNVNTYVELTK